MVELFLHHPRNFEFRSMATVLELEDVPANFNFSALPIEMRFSNINTIVIIIYSNLIWISLVGNLTVLKAMVRVRRRSRVHLLLLNLCVADIIVTVVEMPLQVYSFFIPPVNVSHKEFNIFIRYSRRLHGNGR